MDLKHFASMWYTLFLDKIYPLLNANEGYMVLLGVVSTILLGKEIEKKKTQFKNKSANIKENSNN